MTSADLLPGDESLFARWRRLAGSRGGLALLMGLALTGVGCAFAPLADHLGFEFSAALAIASALLAPAAGIASVRLARERRTSTGRAALDAMGLSVVALLLPIGLILLNAVRRPSCDPLAGLVWLPLLPIPSALLGSATGAFARVVARTSRQAVALVAVAMVVSLGPGLWSLYAGPAFFLFDHFFGYLPGPLYDERVVVSSPLVTFRAMTVLWAVAAALGAAAAGGRRGAALRAALLAIALVIGSGVWGAELGHRTSAASLAEALDGRFEIDGVTVHHPREWRPEQVERLRRDVAFRAAQVQASLGMEPGTPITVWMYRNTEEKRRLVGAANTSFAKPWRREVHIHPSGWPHSVLRHELVHAYAGELGPPPFGTPGGLFPNSPLIEGTAMAFDVESDGLTLAQWSRAMRDLKLAPDLTALLSTRGFYAAAPGRAYTYAGAFVRFIEATRGRDAVLRLYRTGELAELGDPRAIVDEFEGMLDALVVTDEERAAAERRYQRPSVFRRRCAREVSAVTDAARRTQAKGEYAEAIEKYEEACAMEPGDPSLLRQVLQAALRIDDRKKVAETAERLFAHPKLDPTLRAQVLLELGDAEWKTDRIDAAQAHFETAATLPVDPNTRRAIVARLEGLTDPARTPLYRRLLVEGEAGLDVLFGLQDLLGERPNDALTAYLLGRQLVQREAAERGVRLLTRAADAGLPGRELQRENLRLLVRAHAEEHQCDAAEQARQRLAEVGNAADDTVAVDWIARCRFETDRGWTPMSRFRPPPDAPR